MTHQYVSFTKSFIRLVGYVLLPTSLYAAAVVLFISELIGIIEETV